MNRLVRVLLYVAAVALGLGLAFVAGVLLSGNMPGQPAGPLARDVIRYGPVYADSMSVGGGFGSTGCTISSAGVLQCDGAATVGGALTVTGTTTVANMAPVTLTVGGGFGSSGCTGTSAGALSCDGAITSGSIVSGISITGTGGGKFGGASHYASFESDGTLLLTGNATGWEDLRIDGISTRVGAVAPTDETGFRGSASFYSRNFVHNQADEVQFSVQLPHAWKEGSSVYPHVHFSPWITSTGSTAVQLVFDCYDASIDGTFPAASTLYTVTKTWTGDAQWKHLLAGSVTAYSLSGKTLSAVQKCRLYRDNTVANNLAGKIALLYIDWHYEVDTPAGSRGPVTK